jgi:hypothetical protein
MKTGNKKANEQCVISSVNTRFNIGSKWVYNYNKEIKKEIVSEFSKHKVRMNDGQVFSKIFLTKYYTAV